jgi:hypothetical protein
LLVHSTTKTNIYISPFFSLFQSESHLPDHEALYSRQRSGKGGQATCSCRRRTATDAAPSGDACGGTSCPCVPSARKTTKTPCGGGAAGRSPMRKPSRRRSPTTRRRRRRRWRAAPWIPAGGGGARGDRRDPRRGEHERREERKEAARRGLRRLRLWAGPVDARNPATRAHHRPIRTRPHGSQLFFLKRPMDHITSDSLKKYLAQTSVFLARWKWKLYLASVTPRKVRPALAMDRPSGGDGDNGGVRWRSGRCNMAARAPPHHQRRWRWR